MDHREVVRGYYDAIDSGEYDRLRDLLAPEFAQERPDRTLGGRDEFVRFMRDERPRTDTVHELAAVCVSADTDGVATVFARGRLRTADGDALFGFVDVHRVGERIESLTTYTN